MKKLIYLLPLLFACCSIEQVQPMIPEAMHQVDNNGWPAMMVKLPTHVNSHELKLFRNGVFTGDYRYSPGSHCLHPMPWTIQGGEVVRLFVEGEVVDEDVLDY